MFDTPEVTIPESATIEQAFKCLNVNCMGAVFAVNGSGRVVGCVTDGDIRRRLLADNDLSVPIDVFMNRNFVSAPLGTTREQILKLLDHRVHIVPILDAKGRLADICTRDRFQPDAETEVFSRARAPARISFGGGGTDLTHYFVDQGGAVINATICRYAHAAMRRRPDGRICIYSHDLAKRIEANSIAQLNDERSLLVSVLKLIRPSFGFEIEISTDFPIGSGLGGSAAVAAAIIGCFNEFRSDPWDRHQISELAFQAERLMMNIPGGWQDQYATVFGGFNYMEFAAEHNVVLPLRLEPRTLAELEESVVLCYTGKAHDSGTIHKDQKSRMQADQTVTAKAAQRQKDILVDMKRHLLRGDIYESGRLLHQAWVTKREFSPLISDAQIDAIYDEAMANGALGGKLLGAGGGGYFLFFVPPFKRYQLDNALKSMGRQCERVLFEEAGLCSWKTRLKASYEAGTKPEPLAGKAGPVISALDMV